MILSVLLIAAVSCRWPVKPSSVAVKATTTDLSPVSAQDILGFNNILQLAVAPADYIISKEIKAASLDPIKKGIAGSAQKEQNLGICKANVGINYSIDNIKGLSTAALDRIDIKSAEKRLDGAFKLDLEAQIKPFDLAGEISGRLDARCGIVKPHIDINGDLVAERVSLGLILEATAYPLPNKEWYINATITNVTTDFKGTLFHFLSLSLMCAKSNSPFQRRRDPLARIQYYLQPTSRFRSSRCRE